MNNNILYHASDIKNLTEILPLSKAKGSDEKVCYFTPVKLFALSFLRDKEIDHVPCYVPDKCMVVYEEWFPDQLKKTYQGRSGYIYACDKNDAISVAQKEHIWSATQPVPVKEVEYIKDVYETILKAESLGEVQIVRYESFIAGQSDEEKREFIASMKDFFIQRGWLDIDTPQTRFFAEHYPQAWEEAKIKASE